MLAWRRRVEAAKSGWPRSVRMPADGDSGVGRTRCPVVPGETVVACAGHWAVIWGLAESASPAAVRHPPGTTRAPPIASRTRRRRRLRTRRCTSWSTPLEGAGGAMMASEVRSLLSSPASVEISHRCSSSSRALHRVYPGPAQQGLDRPIADSHGLGGLRHAQPQPVVQGNGLTLTT